MAITDNTALILIDVQVGFDDPFWGTRNNPEAESNMEKLLADWRQAGRPVIHVQHLSVEDNPLNASLPTIAFKPFAQPQGDEPVFTKQVNSAFIGTALEDHLRSNGVTSLVIAGLTTNHCVSTTTRMAGNLGFETYLVADACATFDRVDHIGRHYDAQTVHDLALASIHNEFATVVETAKILKNRQELQG